MFKVNNQNFEYISHLFLVFLLLTLNKQMFAGLEDSLKEISIIELGKKLWEKIEKSKNWNWH